MAKTIIVACILSISTGLFAQSNYRENFPGVETKLFAELPDYCPTPDAFAISPDGIFSCHAQITLTIRCLGYWFV